jgi:fibronectin-binding autotransporter adhesin
LTLNSGTTFTFGGNMSAFSGTIKVGTIANPRFHGSTGSANAIFDLGNTSAYLNTRNGVTAYIGALIGGSSTILRGAESADASSTYYIGGKHLDTTFAGRIQEKALTRVVNIVKVGTGTWTLTGASTYTGTTTVNGGTLLVNNTTGTGTGTNSVTVNNSGRLGGTGFIHGPVVVSSGGTIAPGSGGVGTLTLRSNLTLAADSLLCFDLGPVAASDRLVISNALALNGTLYVTNVAGFGAGTYTLIYYGGALSGKVPTIGSMPPGFAGTINTNTSGQVKLIVQLVPSTPPTIGSITVSGDSVLISGTGGPPNGIYYVVAATNVGLTMGNWTRISTNQFDAGGGFLFTNALDQSTPQRFFRLSLP